jgi:hypothetical protein
MEDGEREGVAVQERGMGVAGEAGGGAEFHWDFGPEAHPRLSQASTRPRGETPRRGGIFYRPSIS